MVSLIGVECSQTNFPNSKWFTILTKSYRTISERFWLWSYSSVHRSDSKGLKFTLKQEYWNGIAEIESKGCDNRLNQKSPPLGALRNSNGLRNNLAMQIVASMWKSRQYTYQCNSTTSRNMTAGIYAGLILNWRQVVVIQVDGISPAGPGTHCPRPSAAGNRGMSGYIYMLWVARG